MADAANPLTKPTKASAPFVVFDAASANKAAKPKAGGCKAHDGDADDAPTPSSHGRRRRRRWLRWACCGAAVAGALTAAAVLALSLTVLRVRDPMLSMESVAVRRFSVRLEAAHPARPLRINLTLSGDIVIRNPNYESMRFGASATEIFVDVDGAAEPTPVGVGRAPPGEVPARGASRVAADVDVLVDRVSPAVVAQVLFGDGEVRFDTRTTVDGRLSLLGGLYGRRTVRVAMRCRVALRVSAAAVAVAGSPACVADFGR
ncbi:unnamed protein product [Miscanthus lutarioriparius]|uniref:Late embryogenesis abundant protein LEA-2 subgroup domain-containing protein n=1 Tax=Miscanthus lutarioriparius TaxID=422564 RepID=A0A811RMK4_9POAL|nr:unnamed protein product [Miscanthus lutarioriparius]